MSKYEGTATQTYQIKVNGKWVECDRETFEKFDKLDHVKQERKLNFFERLSILFA